MRLSVPLAEAVPPPTDRPAALCWPLPPLSEEVRLQLARVLRVLALLVERGEDPFAALGQAEQFDARWRQLEPLVASAGLDARPHPDPAGSRWLLAELSRESPVAPERFQLLLDPVGHAGPGQERLLFRGLTGSGAPPPAELATRLSRVWPWRFSPARRSADPAAPVGQDFELEAFVNVEELLQSWPGLVGSLGEQLWGAVPAQPSPPAPVPEQKEQLRSDGQAADRAVEQEPRPSAGIRPRPAEESGMVPPPVPPPERSAVEPGRSPVSSREDELRRAAELGLSAPPEWPSDLTSAARKDPPGLGGDAVAVLEDLRRALPAAGSPEQRGGSPGGQTLPGDEEDEADLPEQVPVNLVLTSAGPFPEKLRRVLGILLSVEYPRTGELIRHVPTILLRGAAPSLARRYAQVLRQAGGRCRILRLA